VLNNYTTNHFEEWDDESLFEKFQSLAEKYYTKGRFTYIDTGRQDLVLGYSTHEELDRIRKATGLNIVWYKTNRQV